MVANVVADLFQAAQGGETADRVGENRVALERKAGSQARHVLLRDAHIEELPGESVDVLVEDRKTQVAGQQDNFRVLRDQFREGADESVSHGWASNSASAASNSAPRGMR